MENEERAREELARQQHESSRSSRFQFDDELSAELHAAMTKNIELHNTLMQAVSILRRIQQQNSDILDVFVLEGAPVNVQPAEEMEVDEEKRLCYELCR